MTSDYRIQAIKMERAEAKTHEDGLLCIFMFALVLNLFFPEASFLLPLWFPFRSEINLLDVLLSDAALSFLLF